MDLAVDSDPSLLDARAVAQHLQTDPVRGLTGQEAARRLASGGANEIEGAPQTPEWR